MSFKISCKKHTISTTLALSALLTLSIGTMPAGAYQRPEQPPAPVVNSTTCPLERVDAQLVRGDNLTGAGVPAPAWIPAQ